MVIVIQSGKYFGKLPFELIFERIPSEGGTFKRISILEIFFCKVLQLISSVQCRAEHLAATDDRYSCFSRPFPRLVFVSHCAVHFAGEKFVLIYNISRFLCVVISSDNHFTISW